MRFTLRDRQYSCLQLKNALKQTFGSRTARWVQYQSKILRQKVKKIETKSQKNWDKKSKKLRLKVKKIETKSQKNWDL